MKKRFNSPSDRCANIILGAIEPDDSIVADAERRLNSNCLPLHRRIKADREFGIRSDCYPYESTFDDDSDVENQNVDSDADFRRSKWTSFAEACASNPSRVKQSEEPVAPSTGEKDGAPTGVPSSAE